MKYVFIFLIAIVFSACIKNPSVEETNLSPTLKINSIQISGIGLDSIDLDISINIKNPYPIDINLKDIMVNVYYQDRIINSNNITGDIKLKSFVSSDIKLDSALSTIDLAKIIKDYTSVEYLPFKIEVAFTLPLPKNILGNYQLKDSIVLNIPTINPQFTLKSMEFQPPLNIKSVFNIKNNTEKNFTIDDIYYNINLNDKSFNGIAASVKNDDGSFDIILDDLNLFSIGVNALKDITNIELEIKTNIQLDGIPYKIPLDFKKKF
ncbi:hypothetical protein CCY99_00410 [Helicobacter sp. 16-1353]|uniref:LEA type 2 family protein n=1 Tax=Helicobacter sp. 16-1353 TaxID=2004996 RepID=UPI000DCF1D26|nr:LEA type 2 family protein [Helicobacter sp. 16-1353]RAX55194.1 hypothetical protein CCY99_00410 [Helicobacter sp. 16-1353]